MNSMKRKGQPPQEEQELEKALDEFAKLVAEEEEGSPHRDFEPLEQYSHRIKAKIHANMDQFRSRFTKGYRVLLEELKNSSNDPLK